MAYTDAHLDRCLSNLSFLQQCNTHSTTFWDWQVTACFYVAVHIANAHLARSGIYYRSHGEVNNALNYANAASAERWPEDAWLAYRGLFSLSRRSRYMISELAGPLGSDTGTAYPTQVKHLGRACSMLDTILAYAHTELGLQPPITTLICSKLQPGLTYFQKVA